MPTGLAPGKTYETAYKAVQNATYYLSRYRQIEEFGATCTS
jgi:hypothetical protein